MTVVRQPNKAIRYALEIYKPEELQAIPGTDECRHYHSDHPFPAMNVGDLLTANAWRFPKDDNEAFKRAMGGRTPEALEPIAVVESVTHSIIDGIDDTSYTVIVQTKLYKSKDTP
jgi:hypothetical protein